MSEEKQKVEEKVGLLIKEFKNSPEKFLTEGDVRCYLYHLLLSDFNTIQNCEDGTKSTPLHTEVRWYGESGQLKLRSDIVILDVSTLRTTEKNGLRLPSKGYGFNKPKIVIEVKLRRKIGEADNKFLEKIKKDREKIRVLNRELTNDFYSFIIIFDKKSNLSLDLEQLNNHKEFYIYPYQGSGD